MYNQGIKTKCFQLILLLIPIVKEERYVEMKGKFVKMLIVSLAVTAMLAGCTSQTGNNTSSGEYYQYRNRN